MSDVHFGKRSIRRPSRSRRRLAGKILCSLVACAAIVMLLSTRTRALTVGGQAYYAFLGNISILGIPIPLEFGPLPFVELPPEGGVFDEALPSIEIGIPITGPIVFSAGAAQVHVEGDTNSNVVLSRASGGQMDLFPVPIIGTAGLLRLAAFELECRLDENGFTSHAAIGGVESALLPDIFDDALWADPPPNTGLEIEGLGSVFLHETEREQVGNMTVFRANGVRIALDASVIPAGGVTGEAVWGHVECAAERPIPAAVAPTSGAAGTAVTITGTGFRPEARVDFAGIPATSVTFVSPTELTAVVPEMLGGTWNVSVDTAVDRGTIVDAFTMQAAVAGLPSDGFHGQAHGLHIAITPAVILGPIEFGPRPVATLPAGGGIDVDTLLDLPAVPGGDLIPGGLLTAGVFESRVEGSPARPSLFAQNTVAGVSVAGGLLAVDALESRCELGPTGLTGSTTLAGISSTVLPDLQVNPPPNFGIDIPGLGAVLLNEQTTTTDPATGRQTFVVNAIRISLNLLVVTGEVTLGHAECSLQPPAITSLAPATGPEGGGTPVTITGLGFGGQPTVTFGGAPATNVTVVNGTTLMVTTPPHAMGPVDVTVTLPTGTFTLPASFTYSAVADVSIVVTGPSTASPGAPLVYTIEVTNLGSIPATGVQVDLPTPPGLTFVSNSGGCTTGFPCDIGTVTAGTPVIITATYDVPADYAGPNPIAATVTATSPDEGAPANNTQTIQSPVAATSSVTLSKTVDNTTPNVGGTVIYTVTAHNAGPLPATNVLIIDKLPAGLTLQSSTPSVGTYDAASGLWTVPEIPANGDATLTIAAVVAASGPITNTASKVGGDQFDPDPSDNVAAGTINAGPTADVRVSKRASTTTGVVGTLVTFTIEASNAGPDPATGVVVTDQLPEGLTFSAATPSVGTYDEATGNWAIGTIAVGTTETLSLQATIAVETPVTNVAEKTAQNELDPVDDTDRGGVTINGETADLQLVMTLDPSNPAPGTQVTVTLTLTNNGPGTATGADVEHALPGGFTFVSYTPPDQGSYDPGTNTWTVGTMPASGPDATATLQVVGVVPPTGPSGITPEAGGNEPDPNPENNSPDPINVPGGAADLQVAINRTGDLTVPGSPVQFEVDIRNVGTGTSNGPITVALIPPDNVTIDTPPEGWTCAFADGAYTCTRSDLQLAPGEEVSLTIGGSVTGAGSNETPATVVVTVPGDPNPSNNIATFPPSPATGPGTADLVITQTAVEGPPGTLTVHFEATNNGPAAAEDVKVVDPLQAGVTFVSATTSAGSCAGTTTIVCSLGTIEPGTTVAGTIVLQLPPAGVVTHTLVATSENPDPDPSNSISTVTVTVQGALVADGDGDGMPDAIEEQFGLDPTRNDADEDPDNDGFTNAEELVNGTHPRGFYSRYFAEGANGAFFDTDFSVFNTDPANPARVLVRLLLDSGGAPVPPGPDPSRYVAVMPLHRTQLSSDDILGTTEGAFSAVIESDVQIVADRVMGWSHEGYGSSMESSANPATTSYFAEGATHGRFDLFYLLENPSPTEATQVEARFLPTSGTPVVRTYDIAPRARVTVHVDEIPGLEEVEVAASFHSSGLPVVVERAMYSSSDQHLWEAGHAVTGASAPSTSWIMAEAATGAFFNAFLLVGNPGDVPADVTVQYQLASGTVITKTYAVPAQSRRTFNVAEQDPQLADATFGIAVTSTQPIVAERAMWWPANGPAWYGAHASMGATLAATRWAVAAGADGGLDLSQTFVLLANQATTPAEVRLTIVLDDGTQLPRTMSLAPTSRMTVDIGALAPEAAGRRFSVLVESVGATPAPLVVEVSRYRSTLDQFWAAGGSAPATAVPIQP